MKRIPLIILVMTLSTSVNAQWHQIADFINPYNTGSQHSELIGLIYFIDHPGPPQIGFEGCNEELWRTTDGGVSWNKCWDPLKDTSVSSEFDYMCFIDSMSGWAEGASYKGIPACWHTTDAGISWNPQYIKIQGYSANEFNGTINYCATTKRLFLTLGVDSLDSTGIGLIYGEGRLLVSTDFGNTWNFVPGFDSVVTLYNSSLPDSQKVYYKAFGDISFWPDGNGIVTSYTAIQGPGGWGYGSGPYFRTTDGGLTWFQGSSLPDGDSSSIALTIPGTSTCFAATGGQIRVYRSDDYGQTWTRLYDFGPVTDSSGSAPYGVDGINGDLNHLIINTADSSLYLSSDEGQTWVNGGIGYDSASDGFWNDTAYFQYYDATYSGVYYNGKIFAGETDIYSGVTFSNGLWEEDWPEPSIVEQQQVEFTAPLATPNPTTDATTISFSLQSDSYVKIAVFGVLGNKISSGFEGGLAAGNHEVPVTLQGLPGGIYYARVTTDAGAQTVMFVKE